MMERPKIVKEEVIADAVYFFVSGLVSFIAIFIDVSAKKTYLFKGRMNWLNTTLGDNEICEHTNFVCIQQRNKKRRCRLIFGFPRIFGMICWS
jgi:hypothetical protein